MRLQDATALVNFKRQPFRPIKYIYKTLLKELKKVLQVMPIENKPHKASSSALAHLDGLLDEALEQTFPASDAVAIDIERESHDREARVLDSRTPLAGNRKMGQRAAQKH
jgi:hypothetical protein